MKKKELEIHYCPTKEMIGDFFTKPLQGALFTKFRNSILGITEEECLKYKEDYYKAKANRESVTSNNSCGWEVTQECAVVSLQKP